MGARAARADSRSIEVGPIKKPRRFRRGGLLWRGLAGSFSVPTIEQALHIDPMEQELTFRIVLENPPPGIDFGLQKGRGNDYEVVQKQRSNRGNLHFEFDARVKEGKDGSPALLGPFVQGPTHERFVYIDIGTFAGQTDTPWSRRLKIPFRDITWEVVEQATSGNHVLETYVPGTGRDGGPTCATVKPFAGWKIQNRAR